MPYSKARNRKGEEIEEMVETHDICDITGHGVHAVFEPSAKVKRKNCLNTGDADANSNREYVEGGIQPF